MFTCLEGWKAKLLSQSGRKILVKHVITSIPLYFMAVGKILVGICEEIEKLSRAFLWTGDENNKKGWILMAWKTICKPKTSGGLGIRSLRAMNSAMLGKIGWCLANDTNKLWVKAVKLNTFPPPLSCVAKRRKCVPICGLQFFKPITLFKKAYASELAAEVTLIYGRTYGYLIF